MWTNIRGYLFFVIYCLILEEFEISTSSPSNSSVELTEKRQEDKFRCGIFRLKHRKAVQDGHLLSPPRETDNKNRLQKKKTTPLCSNQKMAIHLVCISYGKMSENVNWPSSDCGRFENIHVLKLIIDKFKNVFFIIIIILEI